MPRCALQFLLVSISLPLSALAQAWTPAAGELNVALSYKNLFVKDHLGPGGVRSDDGHISTNVMLMDVSYGLTDRLALRVAVPYVAAKYAGADPHQLPIDGGRYHSTLQDFNVDLRYNLTTRGLVVTPSVGLVLPSHDYEYYAHSAVGKGLREVQVGVNLGRRLDPLLRNAYFQGQFNYRFVEKVLNIPHNGVLSEAELGYFVTRRLALIGLATWVDSFGGLSFKGWLQYDTDAEAIAAGVITPEQVHHHDQIGRDRLLNAGGGATYQVNPKLTIFASAVSTVAGANGHALDSAITLGVNWTFRTGEGKSVARNHAPGAAGSLAQIRCMCPNQ